MPNYWWEKKERNIDIFINLVNGHNYRSMAQKYNVSIITAREICFRVAWKIAEVDIPTVSISSLRKHKDYWLKRLSEYRGL